MASVSFENLQKVYPGGVQAVADFTFEVDDGEFVVLVGPSGCGKSTTLRMLAGLEDITSGTLRIGERIVNDVAPKDRDIAMVFQNYALYPHMTVHDNMAFALKLRKTPKDEIRERVNWAAQTLGLSELLQRKPKALSGGQRQRVAVGRAIVRQPAVFLFDEPLSNLDAKLRVETRAELKRLHQQLKTTTIYVTHDQEEAMTLGDRVIVMCDGFIRQCDTPLNVYRRPRDRFVAGFLGMPPMNFLQGTLVTEGAAVAFESESGKIRLTAAHSRILRDYVGETVVLGIRPEALDLCDSGDAQNGRDLTVTIDVVEPLGGQMDLYVRTAADQRLVARVAPQEVRPGSEAALQVNADKLHVFEMNEHEGDPNTPTRYGRNLTLGEPVAVS
jgi:multiple sugar transport system ATP-binding protein